MMRVSTRSCLAAALAASISSIPVALASTKIGDQIVRGLGGALSPEAAAASSGSVPASTGSAWTSFGNSSMSGTGAGGSASKTGHHSIGTSPAPTSSWSPLPPTGYGSSYASACNAWHESYLASIDSAGEYNVSYRTYVSTVSKWYTWTETMTNYSVPNVYTLCDGHPRVDNGKSSPTLTYTTTGSETNYNAGPITYTDAITHFSGYNYHSPNCTIAPSDCTQLWQSYEKNTKALPYGPFCSTTINNATMSRCGPCTIYGGEVKLMYFALPTNVSRDMCASAPKESGRSINVWKPDNNFTITPAPTTASFAVLDGKTFYADRVYISFKMAAANNYCGAIGSTHPGAILTLESSQVSTLRGYNDYGVAWSFNYADLISPVPWSAYSGMGSCWFGSSACETITQNAYKPLLMVPPQIRALDPMWTMCGADWYGLWDPPAALTANSVLLPTDTATKETPAHTTHTAEPDHTTKATPASDPHTKGPTETGNAQSTKTQDLGGVIYSIVHATHTEQEQDPPPQTQQDPPPQTHNQTETQGGIGGVIGSILNGGGTKTQNDPPATHNDPSPATNIGTVPVSVDLSSPGHIVIGSKTLQAGDQTTVDGAPISVGETGIVVGSHSDGSGNHAATTIAIGGDSGGGDGGGNNNGDNGNGNGNNGGDGGEFAATFATLGTQGVAHDPSHTNGVVIGGTVTLSAGSVTTIDGTPVSLASDGNGLVILATNGQDAVTTFSIHTGPGPITNTPIATLGGEIVSKGSSGELIIGGSRTLEPGSITTIDGTPVILSQGTTGGIIILNSQNSPISTIVMPTGAAGSGNGNTGGSSGNGESTFVMDGQAFSIDSNGDVKIAGQTTLSPGATGAVTISNGDVISATSDGWIFRGKSETISIPLPSGAAGSGSAGAVTIDGQTFSVNGKGQLIDGSMSIAGATTLANGDIVSSVSEGWIIKGSETTETLRTGSSAAASASVSVSASASASGSAAASTGAAASTSSSGVANRHSTKGRVLGVVLGVLGALRLL